MAQELLWERIWKGNWELWCGLWHVPRVCSGCDRSAWHGVVEMCVHTFNKEAEQKKDRKKDERKTKQQSNLTTTLAGLACDHPNCTFTCTLYTILLILHIISALPTQIDRRSHPGRWVKLRTEGQFNFAQSEDTVIDRDNVGRLLLLLRIHTLMLRILKFARRVLLSFLTDDCNRFFLVRILYHQSGFYTDSAIFHDRPIQCIQCSTSRE